MAELNSKEYWEARFASKDWDVNGGKEQALFFAKLACSLMPDFLKKDLLENAWTVIDVGCASGEGTAYFAEQFPSCHFIGQDFSESAIQSAKEAFDNCEFAVSDVYKDSMAADVVYSSNTLEHLQNPQEIMVRMCQHAKNYVVHLLPFEDPLRIPEHINIFSLDSFPLRIGEFFLEYTQVFDCNQLPDSSWPAKQILLVYTNQNYRADTTTVLDLQKAFEIAETKQQNAKMWEDLKYSWEITAQKQTALEDLQAQYEKMTVDLKYSWEVTEQKNQEIHTLKITFEEREKRLLEEIKMIEEELKNTKEYSQEQIAILEQKLKEAQEAHANLYAYSCKRDDELLAIQNSRSYQFFVKWLKKPMSITYRIAHKFYRTLKALFTLNMPALKAELGSPLKKCYLRLQGIVGKRKAFATLKHEAKGKRVVVLPPTLDWHMPLFQRPQQLANSYARKENTIVIYLTKNIQYDCVPAAERISDTLWVVNELYADKLSHILSGAAEVILSVSWTPNKKYLDILKPDKFIYEYIDELEIFHMYGPEMEADHQNLMKNADVTICTATKLYNQAAGIAKNPLLSPNAGDYDFFAKTDSYEISPLIADIVKDYQCVLGYYGALAAWFDYELIKEVAAKHPEWLLVLVGIDYDKTIGKSGIEQYPNIVHIPPQPYVDLPKFLKGFDIATIPFLINEITLSTSPVKLFEYMAAGKPILASKMPECLKYESVKTYENADQFCEIVEGYMAMKSDDAYWDILKKDALDNTWDARTEEILEALN